MKIENAEKPVKHIGYALQILVFGLFALSLFLPAYEMLSSPESINTIGPLISLDQPEYLIQAEALSQIDDDFKGITISLLIIWLYTIHVGLSYLRPRFITSFWGHFIFPVVASLCFTFSLLHYDTALKEGFIPIPAGPAAWGVIPLFVCGLTLLLLKSRQNRIWNNLNTGHWPFSTRSLQSETSGVARRVSSCLYPNNIFIDGRGIFVSSMFYSIILPFSSIISMSAIKKKTYAINSFDFASSSSNLVALKVKGQSKVLLLSPENQVDFIYTYRRLNPITTKANILKAEQLAASVEVMNSKTSEPILEPVAAAI